MNGILLVDKPKTWTSFDVVNYVRKFVAQAEGKKPKSTKVGHTGTLDPLATGLLVLLIGTYTKRATELSKLDKTYEVTMKLGETSTTGDAEGKITPFVPRTVISNDSEKSRRLLHQPDEISRQARDDIKKPTQDEIESALQKFTGEIMQTPPIFSAMKVNGQRAYKLARAGKEVKLEPRAVKIYGIELKKYDYPFVEFIAEVSSGTYIRSLVEDLGRELDIGAYMSDLRRTKVGEFDIKDALSTKNLNIQIITEHLSMKNGDII
jgi:tRNA pseudouridine55 synthase